MCVQAFLAGTATFLAWAYVKADGPFEWTLYHFGEYGAVFVVILVYISLTFASSYTLLSGVRPESCHKEFA